MGSSQLLNALVYLRQTVITTVIPFLTTLVLVRFLDPDEFGVFALSQVYAVVLLGIFSLGLLIGYERNYFEYKNDQNKHNALFCSVQVSTFAFFVLAVALSVGLIDQVARLLNIESGATVIIATLVGHAFDKLSQYYLMYYRNSEEASSYSLIMICQVALNSTIALGAVVIYDLGAIGLASGYTLSWIIVYIALSFRWLRNYGFQFDWSILSDVMKISIPVTPRSLAVVIGAQSDKFMLGQFKSVGDVGIYSIAARLGSVVNSFMIAIQNVYVPYLFKHMFSESTQDDEKISLYLEKIIYISIFPALMIILGAYEIVWVLLPEEYSRVGIILPFFALYYGIIVFGKITSKQMLYAKKTGLASILSIIFAVVNVLLNIPLIYYYGIVGAVIATLLTGGLATLVGFVLAQRYKYLPWKSESIFYTLAILFLATSTVVVVDYWKLNYLTSVFLRLLVVGLFLVLGFKTGVIHKTLLRDTIRQIRK